MPQKLLPKPDKNVHLSKYGYNLSTKSSTRQKSLKRASTKIGTLPVLKRLNLIRNLTQPQENKKKLGTDVEFMKKIYAREKTRRDKSKKGSKKSRTRK